MNVEELLKLPLPERVRHLELYGTAHVDSWIMEFAQKIEAMDKRIRELERARAN